MYNFSTLKSGLALTLSILILASIAFAGPKGIVLDPEQSKQVLSAPIYSAFHYDSAGSDWGVYSGYRDNGGSKEKASAALVTIASALRANPNDAELREFVTAKKSKIAYWSTYLLAQSDALPVVLQLIEQKNEEPLAKAFETFLETLGKPYFKQTFEMIGSRDSRAFFGETVISPNRFAMTTLMFDLRVADRLRNEITYGAFWDSHTSLGESSVKTLVELHRQGRVDLARVFSSSLFYYNYYNFSNLSGYSSYSFKEPDLWFSTVAKELGPKRFTALLKEKLLKLDLYKRDGNLTPKELESRLIKMPVESLQDGLFTWAALSAPKAIRNEMLGWYLELTLKGKDWSRVKKDYDGTRDYRNIYSLQTFHQTMRKAMTEYIADAIKQSKGLHESIWDFFALKGVITKDEARQIENGVVAYEQKSQAIEREHAATIASIDAREKNPPRIGVRAALSGGRYGRIEKVDYNDLRRRADGKLKSDLAQLDRSGLTGDNLAIQEKVSFILNLVTTPDSDGHRRSSGFNYVGLKVLSAGIKRAGAIGAPTCEDLFN